MTTPNRRTSPEAVFSSARVPEVTFVKRIREGSDQVPGYYSTYDEWLEDEFRQDQGGFVVYGMTKIGKTSMIEKAMRAANKDPILLEGVHLDSIASFFEHLSSELTSPSSWSRHETAGQSSSSKTTADAGVAKATISAEANTTSGTEWLGELNTVHQAIKALRIAGRPIIVDDFHHCDQEVAAELGKILKPVVRDVLVVLIAIPSQVFAPMLNAVDNAGRFKTVEIRPWAREELTRIGEAGFTELGYGDCAKDVSWMLAREAFGSPHLMQEYCLQTARRFIRTDVSVERAVADAHESMDNMLQQVADLNKPPAFRAIRSGKEKRRDRNSYLLEKAPEEIPSSGLDNYELTLLALREMLKDRPSAENRTYSSKELADLIRTWVPTVVDRADNKSFETNQVARAFTGMHESAEAVKNELDPVLKVTPKGQGNPHPQLDILDPFFKCYLVHGKWLTDNF